MVQSIARGYEVFGLDYHVHGSPFSPEARISGPDPERRATAPTLPFKIRRQRVDRSGSDEAGTKLRAAEVNGGGRQLSSPSLRGKELVGFLFCPVSVMYQPLFGSF